MSEKNTLIYAAEAKINLHSFSIFSEKTNYGKIESTRMYKMWRYIMNVIQMQSEDSWHK